MRVIEAGHIYELTVLDGNDPVIICFVNREDNPHSGTQTQEVLRAQIDSLEVLIDRTNHCDNCLPWTGNERIIKCMSEAQRQLRLALLIHEERAMERKMEKDGWKPELAPVTTDGHFSVAEETDPDLRHIMVANSFDEVICSQCGKPMAFWNSSTEICPRRLKQ